jgi:xylose isomerase
MLGSVDANTGDELLGWDTDQFLMDFRRATQIMKIVIEQDGLAPGGLNFDAKVRLVFKVWKPLFLQRVKGVRPASGAPRIYKPGGHVSGAHRFHGHVCPWLARCRKN